VKQCSKCKELKPFDLFNVKTSMKDGYRSECRSCQAAVNKKNYDNNKDVILKRNKNWRLANPEYIAAEKQKWQKNNPDKVRVNSKRWQLKNPNYKKNYQKNWQKTNPLKIAEYNMRRRVWLAGTQDFVITEKYLRKLKSQPCNACGSTKNIHIDHVVPISRGGNNSEGNLQPLCATCNYSKNNKLWIEFKIYLKKVCK
jgi:5-methylcytosine-specific restriction endonuclease McrA